MTNLIQTSLQWIPLPGLNKEQVIAELTREAVANYVSPMGGHIWVAQITHKGTMLYCYGIKVGPYDHNGRQINVWYAKRVPEEAGPDVYDCPRDILEMCRIMNMPWREQWKAALEGSQ